MHIPIPAICISTRGDRHSAAPDTSKRNGSPWRTTTAFRVTALAAIVLLAAALPCVSAEEPTTPYVLVLGTAQDGGIPQLACPCGHCRAARTDSKRARHVASLLIVDPKRGRQAGSHVARDGDRLKL